MRLLASGIDTLNLSVGGTIRESVLELGEAQRRARDKEDSSCRAPGDRRGLRVPALRLAGVRVLAVVA